MKLLRQALGDDGRSPRYIRSVRGRGYQLCEIPHEGPAAEALPAHATRRRGIAIAAALGIAVAASGGGWLLHSRSTPPSPAQELVQRASYYAGIGQRDNNERAVALYRQALASSPRDRDARIGLSRAYSARVCLYNFPYEWARKARELADDAVRDEPSRAAAWSALAYARDCMGDIDGATGAYEKAFALDPADDASRASAAYLYQERGRLDEALHANLDMHGDASHVRFRDVQIARELELLGFTEAAGQRFVAPDNGVLGMVLAREKHKVRVISEARYLLPAASRTFHGRDIFAPVAAHIAAGVSPARIGKRLAEYVRPEFATPRERAKGVWDGHVLAVDHFGNVITNFEAATFPHIGEISIGKRKVRRTVKTYAEAPDGELVALVGSAGYWEVSMRQASAAAALECRSGDAARISVRKGTIR